MAVQVLHLNDRLGARGGADWHLLGVIRAQVRELGPQAVRLVVGRRDGSVDDPCDTTQLESLDAREATRVELERLIDRLQPRLLHLHNVVNPLALEQALSTGLPLVITVQDHRAFCPGRGKWTLAGALCREPLSQERCSACFGQEPREREYFETMLALTRRRLAALRRAPALTVLSAYMKRELVAAGVDERRVEVIPPFVHGLNRGAAADGPPCLLFVGRMVAAKGVPEAVQAWRRSGLGLPLVLAGSGSARQEVERLAPDAELVGWVPHDDLAALYRRARVLLLPCRWQEPFGIVGLEALTLGTPVAAWDSGGVREWHPGPGLVPWGDIDGLARAARELVGQRAAAPAGFDAVELMQRLHRLYRRTGGGW